MLTTRHTIYAPLPICHIVIWVDHTASGEDGIVMIGNLSRLYAAEEFANMVLSNKKLKAKLRASLQRLAENGGAASLQCGSTPVEVQELLSSARKGRLTLSKREKRRKMRQATSDMSQKGVCGSGDRRTPMENEQDEAMVNTNEKKKREMEENKQDDAPKDNEKKKKKKRSTPIEDEQADATKDNEEEEEEKKKKKKKKGRTPIEDEQVEATKDNQKKKKKKKKNRSTPIEDEQVDATDDNEEKEKKKRRSTPIEDEHADAIKGNKKKEKKKKRRKSVEGIVDGMAPTPKAAEIVTNAQPSSAPESQESEHDMLKVYVGGIPYYSNEDDIRSFFEGCGTVTEVDCMKFPDSGKFRGIALVSFKTEAAAKRALALDGADMGGRYLKIQHFRSSRNLRNDKQVDFKPCKADNCNRAYIGNLAWDITEDDLKNLFIDCKISSIRFGMDKITGQFKGYGHIDFADDVSLAMALKLDQEVVCGRSIKISYAVPKKDSQQEDNSKIKSGGENRKRRTCYVCGVPGHLSSNCPQNQSAELVGSKGSS